ncbi:uncharacterized protein MELLADRAFT_116787 [Melampsora larici-populina 98AG31]|uniref:ASTRA-associated protein 1 n=1 Tax=Melampsora larici-populina (strain 98AG31 / pathotype 3-4-7) TaxID=747676 RepID=F4RPZ9_MELLP|nr:uncharacterized protein MELLADRAFT_116787 [Melampsora larici-populina 98AG31]EGG05627.1 hypothetical protein MELLADRAFT_116787 [Melampsora larici-populina 98AG31]
MTTTGRPPPEPLYTFRPFHHAVHSSPNAPAISHSITHIAFIHRPCLGTPNHKLLQLLTTDELGFVVLWSLESKRAEVLWKPHPDSSKFGGCLWAEGVVESQDASTLREEDVNYLYIVSQGRDHRFVLSRVPAQPALSLNRAAFRPTADHPSPDVDIVADSPTNTTSFCKAALLTCDALPHSKWTCILAAPSSVDEKFVDIFAVRTHVEAPQIHRIYRGVGDEGAIHEMGAVMSVSLCRPDGFRKATLLLVGYESGAVALFSHHDANNDIGQGVWQRVASFRGHDEPIFSMCIGANLDHSCAATAWSVGADHKIVRYDIEVTYVRSNNTTLECTSGKEEHALLKYDFKPTVYTTRSPCRFDVKLRSDGKVMATISAGGKIWMYGSPHPALQGGKLPPLGLLKLKTSEEIRGGVLSFAPIRDSQKSHAHKSHLEGLGMLDTVGNRALLAAADKGGSVIIWEVFPMS